MQYATLISALSLLFASKALASPIYVTEVDYIYETVVVDSSGHLLSTDGTPAAAAVSTTAPVATSTSISVAYVPPATTSSSTPVVEYTPSSSSPASTATPTMDFTTLAVSTSSSSAAEVAAAATSTTSSASEAAVTSLSGDSLEAQFLSVHNKDRALHNVGNLAWNTTLADYAQSYLEGKNCVFAHSGGPYGENIALGYSSATAAANAWYAEESLYDYSAGQYSESTGHFTQMVWKSTTQLGCASVQCSNGVFYACEYYPRGNIIGEFTANVLE